MQTDHRVPTANTAAMLQQQQQHRKRSFSGINPRKRDRHDLICVVCHAPAMGYNFDQITCESCKAFFRRNALNNATKFKCRSGADDCLITLETRKRCKACRLKKCFNKGLRKEWIMSEEEKITKKQKIEDNRRLRILSQTSTMFSCTPSSSPSMVSETESSYFPLDYQNHVTDVDDGDNTNENNADDNDDDNDIDNNNDELNRNAFFRLVSDIPNNNELVDQNSFDYKTLLEDDDRNLLTRIEQSYTRAVQLNISEVRGCQNPGLRNLNDVIDVVNEPTQMSSLRLITFFKLIPEFNSLHEDDRFALVKHNLVAVLYLHLCICTNVQTEIYHEPNTTKDFCYRVNLLRRYSDNIYHKSLKLVKDIQNICGNDHLVIKLAMVLMIFSKGSDFNELTSLHPEDIFRAQNVFIDILWKYLEVRFSSVQVPSIFARLIFTCMDAQVLGRDTKESLEKHSIDNDQLAPLMQSVILNS